MAQFPARQASPSRFALAAASTLVATLAGSAMAADPPAFRPGMWEFSRTVEGGGLGGKPTTLVTQKCTDPGAEMKQRRQGLEKSGCKVFDATSSGNPRTLEYECSIQGAAVHGKSVLTAQSDSAYTVQVTSTGGGRSSSELLQARRIGGC